MNNTNDPPGRGHQNETLIVREDGKLSGTGSVGETSTGVAGAESPGQKSSTISSQSPKEDHGN
ncbi:CBS domain-containing protein [Thermobifida phage P318]|nr:CBS domain-containing protein [Thermobifida phage P318]